MKNKEGRNSNLHPWDVRILSKADKALMRKRITAREQSGPVDRHLYSQMIHVKKHPLLSGSGGGTIWMITEKPDEMIDTGSHFFVLLASGEELTYFDSAFTVTSNPKQQNGCYIANIQSGAGTHSPILLMVQKDWVARVNRPDIHHLQHK